MTFEKAWMCAVMLFLIIVIAGCGNEPTPIADGTGIVAERSDPDVSAPQPNTSDVAAEIQKLIPEASAMAWEDMKKLIQSPMPPKEADVQEKSLTLILLTLKPPSARLVARSKRDDPVSPRIAKSSPEPALPEPAEPTKQAFSAGSQSSDLGNDERKEQFQFLTQRIPKAARLLQEFCRGVGSGENFQPQGPVTFLHADRITDCSCEVNGDTATGTVSFEVPELYRGNVDYVATRVGEVWEIQEFIMSAYHIHLVRNADGKWEKK